MRTYRSCILLFLLCLCVASSAFAQQGTGTLTGTVADPDKAVVPNANVKLTNIENSAVRTMRTNSSGDFRFEAVIPGDYRLEVTGEGFKTLVLDKFDVASSGVRSLGMLTMEIGAISQSVSVTSDVTPVQTASSEQSQTVNFSQVKDVTLRSRDPYGYMHLLPGIIDTNMDARQTPNNTAQGGISVNGMDSSKTQASMDGAPVSHMACNSCFNFVVPNMDAISEVRVLQSGIQAEFGRIAGGGTINFITKSGTQEYHGTLHWDGRNESLNANSFFNNRNKVAKNIYRYLILGGSIGGPAYIPKLMPKAWKNKVFFFYSPEYSTSKQPTNVSLANLPTALERSGDFSQTFYAQTATPLNPIMLTITDPNTGAPFAGNKIPATRFDSTGVAMLGLLNMPNGYVNPATPYAYNSRYSMTPDYYRINNVARIDANLSSNVSLYYRFARDFVNTQIANAVSAGKGCYNQNNPGGSESGHLSYIATSTTVLEVQLTRGFTYGDWPSYCNEPLDKYNQTSTFAPPRLNPYPSTNSFNGYSPHNGYPLYPKKLPSINFAGGNYQNYTSFNPIAGVPYIAGDNQYTWRVDISKVYGGHAFKAGFYWEHSLDFDETSPGGPGGTSFNGTYNFGSTTANPLDSGNGYANALLGNFQSYAESSARVMQARHLTAAEWYAQDNWKVNSRLTIDYGVRFLHNSPSYDDSHYTSAFDPAKWTAANAARIYYPACRVAGATCSPANQYALDVATGNTNYYSFAGNLVPGSGSPVNGIVYPNAGGIRYQAVGVQPRFGFAYNFGGNGKTVIRGSAGVFQNRTNLNNILFPMQAAPPVAYAPIVYYSTVSSVAASGVTLIPPSATAIPGKQKLEGIYQYNLTFERAVGWDTVVSAAYVGNFSRHGQLNQTLNNVQLGAYALSKNIFSNTQINANLLRTQFPGMGAITVATGSVNLVNYHALQMSAKRRMSHGITVSANYTFSKSLGILTNAQFGMGGWDPYHTGQPIQTAFGTTVTLPGQRQWYYGPTGQDRTHSATVTFAYEVPAPRNNAIEKLVLSGWTLSGVTTITSGAAVQPSCMSLASYPTNDPTWTGAGGIRCQVVADWKNYNHDFYNNFNTAAFTFPSGGTAAAPVINFGNVGLGFMRQPSWWNQDLTLAKVFRLPGEGRRIQVSLQTYNTLNHTEFNAIGLTYQFLPTGANINTTTGQYTGANQPRQMVMSARFEF